MFDNTIAVQERHQIFLKRVVESKKVWALDKDGQKLAWCECNKEENENKMVTPFWSDKAYAKQCANDVWQEYVPKEFDLDMFLNGILPHLSKQGVLAGTNWNAHLIGTEMNPLALREEIMKLMKGD